MMLNSSKWNGRQRKCSFCIYVHIYRSPNHICFHGIWTKKLTHVWEKLIEGNSKFIKNRKKIFRKIAEKKIKRLIEWKCVTVFVCFSTWTWICLIYEIWKSFTEWLCVKAWSVHMILKGVWKRNIEKKMIHEMLKMLLVQVQSIKVLSKNRFCS